MDINEFITNTKYVLTIDPAVISDSAVDFYSTYGSAVRQLAIIAKSPTGYVYYNSKYAWVDEKNPDFFSSFATFGVDVGVDIYAVLNVFSDELFGVDPKFRTFSRGNKWVSGYVCPSETSFWDYIAALAKEIAEFGVKGIILTGLTFVNSEYCMCKRCLKKFQEWVGLDVPVEAIDSNSEYWDRWIEWRAKQIANLVKKVSEAVWEDRKEVFIYPTVYLDNEVGNILRSKEEFGQDPYELSGITGTLLLHINPWTPIMPEVESEEFNKLLNNTEFLKEIREKGYLTGLYYWGSTSSYDLETLNAVADANGINKIFIYPMYSDIHAKWREYHLKMI
ncbi:MAG: hypothetical protein ACP6IS_11790 [Candidatus Asgardarchaeia archaeon]